MVRLAEIVFDNFIQFDFVGLDSDFAYKELEESVKSVIKPQKAELTQPGWDSDIGRFVKNGITVNMVHDDMLGLWLSCPVSYPPEQVDQVRKWAKLVFDRMVELYNSKSKDAEG